MDELFAYWFLGPYCLVLLIWQIMFLAGNKKPEAAKKRLIIFSFVLFLTPILAFFMSTGCPDGMCGFLPAVALFFSMFLNFILLIINILNMKPREWTGETKAFCTAVSLFFVFLLSSWGALFF